MVLDMQIGPQRGSCIGSLQLRVGVRTKVKKSNYVGVPMAGYSCVDWIPAR